MTNRLISAAELIAAPTGLDWNTLAEQDGAGSTEENLEQSNLLDSASAWVSNKLDMPLGVHATTQTEQTVLRRSAHAGSQIWVSREGSLNFKTATLPIISVSQLQYAALPGPYAWTQISPSNLVITGTYPQIYRVEDWSANWSNMQFGGSLSSQTLFQLTYVSGWPNAVLTASAAAGTSVTLTVDSTLGMATTPSATGMDNSSLTLSDQGSQEVVTVTNIVDATHVTVASLAYSHPAGVRISNVPGDIRQATIFACMWLARERGVDALVMGGNTSTTTSAKVEGDVLEEAEILLTPYMRRT